MCKFIRKYFSKKRNNRAGEEIVRAGCGNKKDQNTTTKRQDHKKWDF